MLTISDLLRTARQQMSIGLEYDQPALKEKILLKPAEDKWSVIEIIDHLNIVLDLYKPKIEKAVLDAEKLSDRMDKYSYSWIGKLSVNWMKPKDKKRRFKMKTFSNMIPESHPDPAEVFGRFKKERTHLNELLKQAMHIDHSRIKINSDLGPIVKFRLIEGIEFVLAHEERHLLQAKQTISLLN